MRRSWTSTRTVPWWRGTARRPLPKYGYCPTMPPSAVHPVIVAEAIKLVLAGKAIVILGRQVEPVVDVRDGLLNALDLLGPPQDVVGRDE